MKNKKVLFITDSLGLPRLNPEPVYDEQSWPNIVASELEGNYRFYFYTVAGLHTAMLRQALAFQVGAFKPDIIVLQVGIVDCSPRALKENERKVLQRLPGTIANVIHKYIKKNYSSIVKARNITYVDLDSFLNNLQAINEYFKGVKFIVIPIAPSNSKYEHKNPLIREYIANYNAVLKDVFNDGFVEQLWQDKDTEKLFLSDNHHLSVYGNSVVAKQLQIQLQHHL